MLDLVNYVPSEDLAVRKICEPCLGDSTILAEIVRRLSASCRTHGRDLGEAYEAVMAFDVDGARIQAARLMVADALIADGWHAQTAIWMAGSWINQTDYLMVDKSTDLDWVVSRPPYAAFNHITTERYEACKKEHPCLDSRKDAYVAFMEHGLRSLRPGGKMIMLTPKRWMGSFSARKLREKLNTSSSVDLLLDLTEAEVFDRRPTDVNPMLVMVSNRTMGSPVVGSVKRYYSAKEARVLSAWFNGTYRRLDASTVDVRRLDTWEYGRVRRWRFEAPNRAIMRLHSANTRIRYLEKTMITVGIHSGLDQAFLVGPESTIEPDRLLPMVMTSDVKTGKLLYSGTQLVNTWRDTDQLVDLADYPRMAEHLEDFREQLAARKRDRAIAGWYRTGENPHVGPAGRPKLLLPRLCSRLWPIHDSVGLYPHCNFLYITSGLLDLEALGGILISRLVDRLMHDHCEVGRGGTIRLSVETISCLPIPAPETISPEDSALLVKAFRAGDVSLATEVVERLYGIKHDEY